ncbi:MAG TPA: Crp/Fnr family transcriptional regulator [Candidatus Saccharimonadales bacterium]|nr:Crp/Fnr family transcriptional regulator [Candidatus Saccharimonadales bacterium]
MEANAKTKVDTFFRQYSLQTYKKGHVLLLSNETPTHVYYIEEGRVKQYEITYKGNEIIVNIFKPGAYFVMLTALTGLPNLYYFSAETDVKLRCAPVKDVVDFVNNNPDVMKDLLTRVYIVLENLFRRMTHLMSGSARGRVIYEILLDIRGTGEGRQVKKLSITEAELASRAGLSRETVSREVSYLKRKGLLSAHSRVSVTDLPQLEKALEDSF